ncbi:MAG: AsmA family protein [Alcanivoracaceae bacterium]|nr:AsmA family protein [Alcanivoracaceae bacterium]
MRNIKKPIIWIVSGVLLFVFTAVVITSLAVNAYVNSNKFKHKLDAMVFKKIHRHLQVKGDISFGIFPRFSVQIENVTLDNPKGYDKKVFAYVKQMYVSIRLLPLIWDKYEIEHIRLNGATFNLEQKDNNNNNWTFGNSNKSKQKATTYKHTSSAKIKSIESVDKKAANKDVSSQDKPQSSAVVSSKQSEKSSEFDISTLKIANIEFKHVNINFINKTNQQDFVIKQLAVNVKNLQFAKAFSWSTSLLLTSQKSKINWHIDANSTSTIHFEKQILAWHLIKLVINKDTLQGDLRVTNFMTKPVIVAKLHSKKVSLSNFRNFGELDLILENPVFSANLHTISSDDTQKVLGNLSGEINFNIKRSTFVGMDLNELYSDVNGMVNQAFSGGNPLTNLPATATLINNLFSNKVEIFKMTKHESTVFSPTVLKIKITNGNTDTHLKIATKEINLLVEGKFNLVNNYTNYIVKLAPIVEKKAQYTIPITIKGYAPNLEYGISTQGLMSQLSNVFGGVAIIGAQGVGTVASGVAKGVGGSFVAVGDTIGGALHGLFGSKDGE